jgi:acetolactate synthase I/II/III large subunit
MHQKRESPGRVSATELLNPDFDAYARVWRFWRGDQQDLGISGGLSGCAIFLPSIIHLKIDPDAILPAATLTGIREQALRRRN